MQRPDENSKITEPYLCLCAHVISFIEGETPKELRVPWTPSQEDLFAEDWMIEE